MYSIINIACDAQHGFLHPAIENSVNYAKLLRFFINRAITFAEPCNGFNSPLLWSPVVY